MVGDDRLVAGEECENAQGVGDIGAELVSVAEEGFGQAGAERDDYGGGAAGVEEKKAVFDGQGGEDQQHHDDVLGEQRAITEDFECYCPQTGEAGIGKRVVHAEVSVSAAVGEVAAEGEEEGGVGLHAPLAGEAEQIDDGQTGEKPAAISIGPGEQFVGCGELSGKQPGAQGGMCQKPKSHSVSSVAHGTVQPKATYASPESCEACASLLRQRSIHDVSVS